MSPGDRSTLDQADVARARALRRFFRLKFHALSFSQQFEYRPPHGAAVEKVLDAAFIAYEAETFVDEQACDCPGWHGRVLRCASAWRKIQALHEPLVSEV
jgi:hypothetical protein